MKKLIVSLLAVFVVFSVTGCGASDDAQAEKVKKAAEVTQTQQESIAPDEVLKTLDGKTVKLKDLYMEKPVYLNFWASWCPPCVKEMPHIENMYKKYGDKVNFVVVSVDSKEEQARAFDSKSDFTMPIYTGDINRLSDDYGLSAIAVSILIDTHGKIVKRTVGGMDEAALEKFIKSGLTP